MKKILPSSSSSSSSTTSFDATVCNSKRATASCIVGVIRRLFCTTNLPKYPSDQITSKVFELCENDQILKERQREEELPTPGLMARLMGLENMPVNSNSRRSKIAPNSNSRSRSMNSADYSKECDGLKQGRHRRTKTSLSFREVPMFLELENDDYFILSFENQGKAKKLRSKGKNSDVGIEELKHRKAKRRKDKENGEENVFDEIKNMENQEIIRNKVSIVKEKIIKRNSEKPFDLDGDKCNIPSPAMENSCTVLEVAKQLNPIDHKRDCDLAKLRKKMENHSAIKKVLSEIGSEDSSPVSVFDFEEFLFDLEAPVVVSEDNSKRKDSNSRRKLSSQLENYENPSSPNNIDEKKSRKNDVQCVTMWCEICNLVKEDIMKSNWRCKERKIEEITGEFQVQILDQLLNEMVVELNLSSQV